MTISDDTPRPMKPGEQTRLRAHSRGKHKEQPDELCPMCRDPDYWTKKAKRLARLATPVNESGTDPHLRPNAR